ncbi:hypothetical protein JCM16303_000461 [Sporobolomyces ruberrimus]
MEQDHSRVSVDVEQNTTTSASLLPPFDPLPPLSNTFQSTSSSFPSFSPLPSRSASPTPFATPVQSTLSSPQPSPSVAPTTNAFFARLRSNSLHNSAFPSSSSSSSHPRRQRECSPPPVPSISSTPRNSRVVSNTSCKLSPPSLRTARDHELPPSPSIAVPLIKSVTVPHHSKSGKNWLFACRVVPVAAATEGKGKARVHGLGKMEMANDQEPYTVYRSWSECVDFSARLAQIFPDDRQTSYESRSDLFNHQVPRLSRKLVLFMTRSVLEQRKAELDLFCRRLFQMSESITHSLVVRSFFGLKHAPGGGVQFDFAIPDNIPVPPMPAFAGNFEDKNATIKPVKPKPRRPALSVKTSTPNLRSAAKLYSTESDALSPETTRSIAASRAFTVDGADLRAPSELSMSSQISFASSTTVTPSIFAAAQAAAALPSPTPSQDGRFRTLRKKASGPLRHFRSLQDLRGGSSPNLEVPDVPVPSLHSGLAAPPMMRFASQPHPRPTPTPLQYGAPVRLAGPTSAPLRPPHRRNGSSSSSIASAEGDLWGTSYPFPAPSSTFRQTPTGRLESVPLQESQRSYSSSSHHRRHAGGGGGGSISTQKASLGHSSSASISSLESLRSSTSMRSCEESGSGYGSRSARNSFDWGSVAGDGFCPTPPTPQSPWAQKDGAFSSTHNLVPPPPFFPVPPSMTSAYSYDGLSRAPSTRHARKSSLEFGTPSSHRSRTDSSASRRLDSLNASPSAVSNSTGSSSPGIGSLDPRPKWTFKLLHSDENVVLRIAREDLTLDRLRSDTRAKFKAAGVDLSDQDAHWGLSYAVKAGGHDDLTTSKLIITQEDLDECLLGVAGKVTLKVIT